jgi:ketosteroid isomerase-like protein
MHAFQSAMVAEEPAGESDAARFVGRFAAVWAQPSLDGFAALLHPDARLSAPQMVMNTTTGREDGLEELRRLLVLWPDVHVDVNRWSASGDVVFIELTMVATIGGQTLRVPAVDRIALKNGLVIERVSYTDSLSPLLTLLRHPSEWLRWWKSGLGFPRRRCRLAVAAPRRNPLHDVVGG